MTEDTIEITLPCGRKTTVDRVHQEDIARHSWNASKNRDGSLSCVKTSFKGQDGKQVYLKLHRFICILRGVDITGLLVDHDNRNVLDNRFSNLRPCTQKQNSQNRSKIKKDTSCRYKGVSWDKRNKKWEAYIYGPGHKKIHLGFFDSALEAALAYDKKAIELFGKFACTNAKAGLL